MSCAWVEDYYYCYYYVQLFYRTAVQLVQEGELNDRSTLPMSDYRHFPICVLEMVILKERNSLKKKVMPDHTLRDFRVPIWVRVDIFELTSLCQLTYFESQKMFGQVWSNIDGLTFQLLFNLPFGFHRSCFVRHFLSIGQGFNLPRNLCLTNSIAFRQMIFCRQLFLRQEEEKKTATIKDEIPYNPLRLNDCLSLDKKRSSIAFAGSSYSSVYSLRTSLLRFQIITWLVHSFLFDLSLKYDEVYLLSISCQHQLPHSRHRLFSDYLPRVERLNKFVSALVKTNGRIC